MASLFSKLNIRGKYRTATGHAPGAGGEAPGHSGTKALSKTARPSKAYTTLDQTKLGG